MPLEFSGALRHIEKRCNNKSKVKKNVIENDVCKRIQLEYRS